MNIKQSSEYSGKGVVPARYGLMSVGIAALVLAYHVITGVLLDSYIAQASLTVERLVVLGAVIVPLLGVIVACVGLFRDRRQMALLIIGLVLNLLLGVFFGGILLIAG